MDTNYQLNAEGYDVNALSLDEAFVVKASDFALLNPGDCDYKVLAFSVGQYAGGGKMGPCPTITAKLEVTDGENTTTLDHRFFLHQRGAGMLSAFAISCGVAKDGESLNPRQMMQDAVGATGRCRVDHRTFTGNDGVERKSNNINKFYPPMSAQPTQAPQSGGFGATNGGWQGRK